MRRPYGRSIRRVGQQRQTGRALTPQRERILYLIAADRPVIALNGSYECRTFGIGMTSLRTLCQ